MKELVDKVIKGDIRAIAKLISMAENNSSSIAEAMGILHHLSGKAKIIGVTGVMGTGKSTLIYELAKEYRKRGKKVGIIAVDPTSPFSGGALLGDRVRMMELATDKGVFIRSMGTRGKLGGLTGAVYDVVEILDAAGMDVIIVETVGVGQAEVDIIKIADTTLVVLVPGLGDFIQTIKAGLMEIADVFVVNKADRPGIDQILTELKNMIDISVMTENKEIPIVTTVAKEHRGIEELIRQIEEHESSMEKNNLIVDKKRIRYEAELVEIIRKNLMSMIFDEKVFKNKVEALVDSILKKEIDPYSAADEILKGILK